MAVATTDPVLRWASIARDAEAQTGIPMGVLLGLIKIESGGIEGRTSSANAGGLTQFVPATARQYDVDVSPGNARSQIIGTARYLRDLGFAQNPNLALKSYNAGPANPAAAGNYDAKVLSAARRYGANVTGAAALVKSDAPEKPTQDGGGLFDDASLRSSALTALVWTGLLIGGFTLIAVGAVRAAGARPAVLAA